MADEQSGGKRSYEPPRVLRLEAAGEAAGACLAGSAPGLDCTSGQDATAGCMVGGAASACEDGSAAGSCFIGSGP
jgi:hypothetical protein